MAGKAPVESKFTLSPMPLETFEQLLDRAAAVYGIEPEFWDIWGRHHVTGAAAKQALLAGMGIAARDAGELGAPWPESRGASGSGCCLRPSWPENRISSSCR